MALLVEGDEEVDGRCCSAAAGAERRRDVAIEMRKGGDSVLSKRRGERRLLFGLGWML